MNRSQYNWKKEVIHPTEREKKAVIIDADSICFIASYTGKDENGNKNPEYNEDQYEIAEGIASDWLYKILAEIDKTYDVCATYVVLKGNNRNIRKDWLPSYKQGRPEPLPIIRHLHNYIFETWSAIQPELGESDDLVADLAQKYQYQAIICGNDKDLFQVPGLHYSYTKDEFRYIDKAEAKYLFHIQWLKGDAGDGVNLSPKLGQKGAEKLVSIDFNDWEYLNGVYQGYLKCWKGDHQLAQENMTLAYRLLKLHTMEELKELELQDNLLSLQLQNN